MVTSTSDLRGAATDATVFVELHGELGDGPRRSLLSQGSAEGGFGRGQTDTFVVQLPELGVLQALTIGRESHLHTLGRAAIAKHCHDSKCASTSHCDHHTCNVHLKGCGICAA